MLVEFNYLPNEPSDLCGKREYPVARFFHLDPVILRWLLERKMRASNLTIMRLNIALAINPKLIQVYPVQVPFILNALTGVRLSNGFAF